MSVLRRLGGHPALDFVNTVDPREGDEQIEYLNSFEDLVQWAVRGRLIDAPTARVACTQAARSPSSNRRGERRWRTLTSQRPAPGSAGS